MMVKQFRIDRFNGVEFLVCEVYNRHTWTKSEMDAYLLAVDDHPVTQADFSSLLDEWLKDEHSKDDSFFGLREPIPAIEAVPCIIVRGAVVNNKIASVACDFVASVTPLEVMDCIGKFFEFVRSPHWRNTIKCSIANYGSLFGTEGDS